MTIVNEPQTNRTKKPVLLKNGNPQGNPMNAPRCGAKTRKGTPCKAPAMSNGRCRMVTVRPSTPDKKGKALRHGR